MWPFTSRRLFGNRWWAVGFVAFVCWQVADIFGQPGSPSGKQAAVSAQGANQIDDAQLKAIVDSLNNIQSAE